MKQKRPSSTLGIILYTIGLLVGAAFILFTIWGDFESGAFWGTQEAGSYVVRQPIFAELGGLNCPIFVKADSSGEISTKVINESDEANNLIFQISVSDPSNSDGQRNEFHEIELAPRESRVFKWQVSDANKVFGRVVLVRTYLYKNILMGPARTKSCGVLVNDIINLNNNQLVFILVTVSISLMGIGLWLYYRANRPLKKRAERLTFALAWMLALVIIASATGLFGFYIITMGLGILLFISMYSLVEVMSY